MKKRESHLSLQREFTNRIPFLCYNDTGDDIDGFKRNS